MNFFDTYFNLGKSSVKFSGDFVIAIIGWFTNFFKGPVQLFINEFFQPFVNFVINSIIIPDFLENGLLDIGVSYNNTKFDDLIIDMTLPSEPKFFN